VSALTQPDLIDFQKKLEDLFASVTVGITGLNPKFVRIAFPIDGQPGFEPEQDVAFVNVSIIDNPYDKQRDIVYRDKSTPSPALVEETVSYTTVIMVDWSIFGPKSLGLALGVKSGILKQPIRSLLKPFKVFPIPEIQAPVRAPYSFNQRWWNRTDLRVLFNVHITEIADKPTFASATATVKESGGESRLIVIPIEDPNP
jgi:hypothetical protein